MAPSSKTRTRQPQPQAPVFRITKSSRLNERPVSYLKQKIDAIEEVILENAPPVQASKIAPSQTSAESTAQHAKKRRRNSEANETDAETNTLNHTIKRTKRTAASSSSVPSPKPRTQDAVEDLPEVLQDLRQLHKHLLHALSVHYAHTKGGIRDVVHFPALLPTMTRLWRKKSVQVRDVQRVLALWEVNIDAESDIMTTSTTTSPASAPTTKARAGAGACEALTRARGPFRMEQIGIGATGAVTLEYTWADANPTTSREAFIETDLQRRYEQLLRQLSSCPAYRGEDGSFIWTRLDDAPTLQCELGKTTQLRREKVASIKSHILSKTTPSHSSLAVPTLQPDLSRLSIHSQHDHDDDDVNANVNSAKSRTLSLFDRVRAKQQLSAAATALTPAQQLRQRALQRIPELVDVLRLKQARKLTGQGHGHGLEMQVKVSFSFEALVQEIRDSLRGEVAGEEIREGIVVLGRDVPGEWCRVYEVGSVKCVTLQGEAVARRDVELWCRAERDRTTGLNL